MPPQNSRKEVSGNPPFLIPMKLLVLAVFAARRNYKMSFPWFCCGAWIWVGRRAKELRTIGCFSPTHLKNMRTSNWIMKPQVSGIFQTFQSTTQKPCLSHNQKTPGPAWYLPLLVYVPSTVSVWHHPEDVAKQISVAKQAWLMEVIPNFGGK